ncbi:integral membrane protein [Moniliophthora roreri MCA 2997]|uniref:Integral membrane protein n=1 Tax=Moniliophthora roreri (strain MCA 2997) TaxID=1381753 RepID=V2X6B9_MONRO|nr:integral membrane protein [Moniliophthora roreri MCA 2997]
MSHQPGTYSNTQTTLLVAASRIMKAIVFILQTIHAFSKSDYTTTVIPVTLYGFLTSPQLPSPQTTTRLLAWIWLFLLQFCAANQMYSVEEDSVNKPYRPIPSGLISVGHTYILRWMLFPVCLYLSWDYGVLSAGVSLTVAFVFYNEFGLDSYWCSKNLLNAIDIVSWHVGAARIACNGTFASRREDDLHLQCLLLRIGHHGLLEHYPVASFISVALIWTTVHVQDFRDVAGDLAWSVGLGLFWQLRKSMLRTEAEDKLSYTLYLVWFTVAQSLPFITYRIGAVW